MKEQGMTNSGEKGLKTEELLRRYFLSLGYFVIRGVKLNFREEDITDIDLWLYMRSSPLSRERVNVDIKSGKTPQAMERILWARGMQEVMGFDRCIVATTAKKTAVRIFGMQNNVQVLDGNFLSRLRESDLDGGRLSEEELLTIIDPDEISKFKIDWRKHLQVSKSRIVSQLNFSGCNSWLNDVKLALERLISDDQFREAACRLTYLFTSYFLIGLDYAMTSLTFMEPNERASLLAEGLKHGELGKDGVSQTVEMSLKLIEAFVPNGRQMVGNIRRDIARTFESIPTDILKEFFGRSAVASKLFSIAKEFEKQAYARSLVMPQDLDDNLKSIVAVLADYSEIDRNKIIKN